MNAAEQKTVDYVKAHAARLHVDLEDLIESYGEINVKNPAGFDFVCPKGKSKDLLRRIMDSARFGMDAPNSLFGFAAGCVARRDGYSLSFREIGEGASMHIQIGNSKCNVHVDSIGIAPTRDSAGANVYDFSKITAHWEKDLMPTLGPLQHFDFTALKGRNELTGTTEFGGVLWIKKRF